MPPSMSASSAPGMTPATNICPTDAAETRAPVGPSTSMPEVATQYITITIDGGMRMPSAPAEAMVPTPKRVGKPCFTIAGSRIEPMATTVAGEEPDTAANSAQANTAARPRPPDQCPTIDVAKRIMRRATPPCVRKLPARMKNGIAMISNFSMPVKSFSATASTGTWVIVNRNVSTVRPSAIETGMPVSISAASRPKMIAALMVIYSRRRSCRADADWAR